MTDQIGHQLGADLTITDQGGVVVGAPITPATSCGRAARDPLVPRRCTEATAVEVRDVEGAHVVTGYRPVKGSGWTSPQTSRPTGLLGPSPAAAGAARRLGHRRVRAAVAGPLLVGA